MSTIITHFYNEEYLLPWWLEHHKKYFKHGILIDYNSTDRSVAICKQICPDWTVVQSKNLEFGAIENTQEVLEYESNIDGWRICLNVTEFLVGNVDAMLKETYETKQHLIPQIAFFDWNPVGSFDKSKCLWDNISHGITYKKNFKLRRARSLHNYRGVDYNSGRHYETFNCEDVLIFNFSNCISTPEMLQRRLQIQEKIPMSDVLGGHGLQHHNHGKGLKAEDVEKVYIDNKNDIEDCTFYIKKYTDPNSLLNLAIQTSTYDTDELSKHHTYYEIYENHWKHLKDKKLNIVEIGIHKGDSLKALSKYFPNATILGIDLTTDNLKDWEDLPNVKLFQCDQTDRENLTKILETNCPYGIDIVIEDASHVGIMTKKTLDIVFPLLKHNGYYSIEDWGTGYWDHFYDGKAYEEPLIAHMGSKLLMKSHSIGMVGVVKSLIDDVAIEDIKMYKNKKNCHNIKSISYYRGIALLQKG